MYLTRAKLEETKIKSVYPHPELVLLESGGSRYLGIVYYGTSYIPKELLENEAIHLYKLTGYESIDSIREIGVPPIEMSATLVLTEKINLDVDYTIYSIEKELFKIEMESFLTDKLNEFLASHNSLYNRFITSAVGNFAAAVNITK